MKSIFDLDSPFMTALTRIGDLVCLSAMWLVFSLPVFTIGASSAALYYAVHDCFTRNKAGIWKHFWSAFKENFRRSTLLWLVELAVLALLTLDAIVLRSIKLSGGALGNLYWAALILEALALAWTAFVAAYSARFDGGVKDILRFSILLMRLHPIRTLSVLLTILAGLALTLVAPFLVIIAPAAITWANSITIEKVFRLHMKPEDLEKETALDALDKKE